MSEPPRAAVINLPSWMWGGNPTRFVADADLVSRRNNDDGRWSVATKERHTKTRPALVMADRIAGPGKHSRFDWLDQLARQDKVVGDPSGRNSSILARVSRKAERSQDPVDMLAYFQLLTLLASASDLSGTVAEVFSGLREVGMESDASRKPFAACSVYVVRRSAVLMPRAKLASVMLRIAHDPLLRQGALDHLKGQEGTVFASSEGLHNGVYLFEAYLGPLNAALTPAVWLVPVYRSFGAVLYCLGQPLAGTTDTAAEILQLLPVQGAEASTPVPALSPTASGAAVEWWASKLNELFAVLTDPAVFCDQNGTYVAEKHLHALLTVEQLFRRVYSIQVSVRDANARRVLLFSVLDTLERLTGRNVETHCTMSLAAKTRDRLRALIPADAAEVLLPGADSAVRALSKAKRGFFMADPATVAIELPARKGGSSVVPLDQALAKYVQVLRDATHGHGANRANRVDETNALLAHHSGHLPHDLGLLGYLYLLDLLCRPDDLVRGLYRGGAV